MSTRYPLVAPHNFAINAEWYQQNKDASIIFARNLKQWYTHEDPPGFGSNAGEPEAGEEEIIGEEEQTSGEDELEEEQPEAE